MLANVLFFALFALASAAPAKENLDVRLHALSSKVQEASMESQCGHVFKPSCKNWCHLAGEMTWEAKCATDFHCCSGCPRCEETENLMPAQFLIQSAADSGYCVKASDTLDEGVNLVWKSGCGGSSLKFSVIDGGNGAIILHTTADNDVVGDSEYCIHPDGTVANGVGLTTVTDCSTTATKTQLKPVWDGEQFKLQSVGNDAFCIHADGGTVADDVALVFKRGCGDDALSFDVFAWA
jgi:hypothetical protein